ncbi:hypothetical protein EDB92DRAFT_1884174 [Lactarius akahatsu]|uniref:Uncharacterized protein n=1 Tax=Lactarius akahatsu TaxID=416441 RepID=A0AAD4LE61_9AGAM|nr:hypothetical protein EDB92DRAFT_1884174 [Lactarius akahatsu]
MSCASSTFDTLTYHRELREAQVTLLDSDFDRILGKLVQEWYYIGASVSTTFFPELQELIHYPSCFPSLRELTLLLHSVDTTVFGFSSSNLFDVDGVASALGLFVDVWFILAYSSADVHNFQTLAVDLYGSYFFFALSSRLPLVALSVAVLALVVFFSVIAWTAWPAAVLVMCVHAGVLVSLQFIVYGSHRLALACFTFGAACARFLCVVQPLLRRLSENSRWARSPCQCNTSSRHLRPRMFLDLP